MYIQYYFGSDREKIPTKSIVIFSAFKAVFQRKDVCFSLYVHVESGWVFLRGQEGNGLRIEEEEEEGEGPSFRFAKTPHHDEEGEAPL